MTTLTLLSSISAGTATSLTHAEPPQPPPKNLKTGSLLRPLPFLSPQNHTSARTQALLKKVTPGTFTWPSSPANATHTERKKETKSVPTAPSQLISYSTLQRNETNTLNQHFIAASPLPLMSTHNQSPTEPSKKVPATPSTSPSTSPREKATHAHTCESSKKSTPQQEISVIGLAIKKHECKTEKSHRLNSRAQRRTNDTYSPPLTPLCPSKGPPPSSPEIDSFDLSSHAWQASSSCNLSSTLSIQRLSPRTHSRSTTPTLPLASRPPVQTPPTPSTHIVLNQNGPSIFLKPIKQTQTSTHIARESIQDNPKTPEEEQGNT